MYLVHSNVLEQCSQPMRSFKGTDSTFGGFPERLQHVLSETIPNVTVECIVFPAYEVRESWISHGKALAISFVLLLFQTKGELVSNPYTISTVYFGTLTLLDCSGDSFCGLAYDSDGRKRGSIWGRCR